MAVIGISGAIGSGKSSLARYLAALEPKSEILETSQVVAEVAQALLMSSSIIPDEKDLGELNNFLKRLPEILRNTVRQECSFNDIKLTKGRLSKKPLQYEKLFEFIEILKNTPSLKRGVINDLNKDSYRPLLQWLGGYLVENIDKGIWYKEILRRAKTAASNGCKLVIVSGVRFPYDAYLVRRAKGTIIGISRPGLTPLDESDITENQRKKIKPDALVINNSDLLGLKACANKLLKDIKSGDFSKTYSAKDISL